MKFHQRPDIVAIARCWPTLHVGTKGCHTCPSRDHQLRDELKREAQRLSRTEEQNRLDLERARRDLERENEACKEERTVVADLERELEESLARAREGRDAMESERSEMLREFHEVKTDLEVREEEGVER